MADNSWNSNFGRPINFGYSHSCYWLLIPMPAVRDSEHFVLSMAAPLTDSVRLWQIDSSGIVISFEERGDRSPRNEAGLRSHNIVAPVKSGATPSTVLLRIRSESTLTAPIRLEDLVTFAATSGRELLVIGVFLGFLGVIAVSHLLMFAILRESVYLAYGAYVLLSLLGYASLFGVAQAYFWSGPVEWVDRSPYLFVHAAILAAAVFARLFLDVGSRILLNTFAAGIGVLAVIGLGLAIFGPVMAASKAANVNLLLLAPALILVAFQKLREKYRPARYFLIAWAFLIAGLIVYNLRAFGLLPHTFWTAHSVSIGAAVEVALLSLALGDRIAALREAKARSEEEKLLEKSRMLAAADRFVPAQFLRYLGRQDIGAVQLGDAVRTSMTVFFMDIRDFTSLAERQPANETFRLLNAIFGEVSPIISFNGGFIDKFIGDAVMALFPGGSHAALQAAWAIESAVEAQNASRSGQGLFPVSIGIGIHHGELILGTLGEPGRMDTTVISDAVNLASRIESLTRVYGVSNLISAEAVSLLGNDLRAACREVDTVRVKGRSEPAVLYNALRPCR